MELGPYDILEEIGSGGMGVVCRARHRELGHEVALKMIAAGEEAGRDLAERFRREAQAAGALAGTPGIVGVRDTGIDPATGTLWLAMDFIAGESLEAVARSGELDHRGAAALMAEVAGAVAAAHAKGFIHRDLKPGNVLVDHAGTAWVTDFGLVRTERAGPEVTRLTRSGEIVGTPAYMAPEQVMGGAIDARTDVYGLGATLYELLTGSAPFAGDSMLQVLQSTLRDPPPMAPLRSAGVPEPLQRVVACALAKDPAHRYQAAAQLAEDLHRWLDGVPVVAQQPAAAGRHRPLVVGAAVIVLAAAGGAWWWMGGARPARPAPPPADLQGVKAERQAAELASARFHAYLKVDQACGKPLATLQARWFGAPVAPEAVAAARRAIDTAIEAAGPDAEPHAAAWRAMAAYFGGDQQALSALRAAADVAGPDPFPRLIKARVLLARYLGAVGLPGVSRTALPSAVEFAESDEAKQLRLEFDFALRSLRKAEWWSLAPRDPFVEQLGAVATALATADHEAVHTAAEELAGHPGLAPVAADLAAFARFQLRDFAGAGDLWAALIERLGNEAWPALQRRAAQARCWQAVKIKEPAAKAAAARLAIAHADAALEADRTDVTARLARLSAYADLGRATRGTEGRAWMAKAVADGDFLVELTKGSATAHYERALALVTLGYQAMLMMDYDAAARSFGRGQADADKLIEINPRSRRAHSIRSLAYEMQAALDDHFERDSRPALRAVTHSLGIMVKIRPDARAEERLLKHSSHLAWSEVKYGGDPTEALKTAEAMLKRAPEGTPATKKAIDNTARAYLRWGYRREQTGTQDPTFAWMRAAELYARLPENARAQLSRLTGLALLVRWSKKRGRLDAAQTAYALQAAADAAARLPASVEVHAMRAGLFEALGREADAIRAYERVLELQPGHALATRELAKLRGK